MVEIIANNIKGAYPAIDGKKIGDPFVLTGKNYLVDLDGPKSAFGCLKTNDRLDPKLLPQEFRIGSEIFYFAWDVDETFLQISKVNWPARQVIPVATLVSADLNRPKLNFPWTHAFVGTYHYFANRTWGVLQYDAINKNWVDVTATIGIENIFFICESGGRLCTLAEGAVTWSAIDDGMDNVASTATGAGAQFLSIIGSIENNTDYLGIQKVSTGFLTFTSKGSLRSELIESSIPFRHVPSEIKKIPLTPWCFTKTTETDVMILSRHGLFTTVDGVEWEEFQPLQNEYFKQREIPPLQSLSSGFISLHYSKIRDELYVSFAQNETVSQYTKAWVLYVKSDAWSTFNRAHCGFVEIDLDTTATKFEQAFIDEEGRICYLSGISNIHSLEAENTFGSYHQQLLEYDPFQLEGVNIMPTKCRMAGFSAVGLPDLPGFYELLGASETQKTDNEAPTAVVVEGDVNIMPTNVTVNGGLIVLGKTAQDALVESVDSEIEIGLFRVTDEESSDRLTLITNVGISCLDVVDSEAQEDDWLEDYPSDISEDWNLLTAEEDWGEGVSSGSSYTQQIRGSLDGYETFEDQLREIDEVQVKGKTKFCTTDAMGLYHGIILTADEVDASFHLKLLALTGTVAGRI